MERDGNIHKVLTAHWLKSESVSLLLPSPEHSGQCVDYGTQRHLLGTRIELVYHSTSSAILWLILCSFG